MLNYWLLKFLPCAYVQQGYAFGCIGLYVYTCICIFLYVCQQKTGCLMPYHSKISHWVYSTNFFLTEQKCLQCGLLRPASCIERAIHTFLLEQRGPPGPGILFYGTGTQSIFMCVLQCSQCWKYCIIVVVLNLISAQSTDRAQCAQDMCSVEL